MTIQEFDNTAFRAGMEVVIHSRLLGTIQREIATVDFDQALIGVRREYDDDDEQFVWYRCENCDIVVP